MKWHFNSSRRPRRLAFLIILRNVNQYAISVFIAEHLIDILEIIDIKGHVRVPCLLLVNQFLGIHFMLCFGRDSGQLIHICCIVDLSPVT